MTSKNLVDPELLGLLDILPPFELSDETLESFRQNSTELSQPVDLDSMGVCKREVFVPVKDIEGGLRCIVYEPAQGAIGNRPGYFHIHGGGLVLGSPEIAETSNARLVEKLGIKVVSVNYRLAPDFPYPTPLDDCHLALHWMFANASELGIDSARIAVGGESAGGGLAAALVQRIVAEGELSIAFQHLTFPMLDDRTSGEGCVNDPYVGEFIWTHDDNRYGWSSYLADNVPVAPAVPARAVSLEGQPPTWIAVGGLDLFLDEGINYARRLTAAGVATEMIIYPSAYHGFMLVSDAAVSKRYIRDQLEALARGLSIELSVAVPHPQSAII